MNRMKSATAYQAALFISEPPIEKFANRCALAHQFHSFPSILRLPLGVSVIPISIFVSSINKSDSSYRRFPANLLETFDNLPQLWEHFLRRHGLLKLSATKVRALREPGRYSDADGLHLSISKVWPNPSGIWGLSVRSYSSPDFPPLAARYSLMNARFSRNCSICSTATKGLSALATSRGVDCVTFIELMSAPFSTRSTTMSLNPQKAAQSRGVPLNDSRALMSMFAPLSSRMLTIS